MRTYEIHTEDYLSQLNLWAKANKVPLSATFELTPFCNFSCVMCYVRLNEDLAQKQGQMLRAEQWIDIARQAREQGTLYLSLTGGEPFTHPEFWKIYSELNKMGFLITILSNGSLIDEETMANFERYGMPYSMKLTMYGASDETYLRTCRSPDGFTRLCRAVELLKKAKIPFKMTSTIVKENAGDLQAIYQFARKHGIPLQHTVSVVKSSRGSINSAETSRFSLDNFKEELSISALEKCKFPPLTTPFAWCGSFNTSFWMTWNGHLQLCSFMNKPFVPYSGNFHTDWLLLQEKLMKIKNPRECSTCEWSAFCQRCPGILCAESGDPETIDPGLCNIAKRLYELYHSKRNEEI